MHDRTDGNPFFVSELLRLLQSEGMFAGDEAMAAARRAIPAGVREVLQRRLARLPEQTNAILLVGAIAGRDFDLDLVEAVAGLEDERALEAAEAAVVAGLVVEDDETVGRYRFAHGLVGETIYENISKARRVRLHARVGQALSGLHGNDPEHVLEIARHAWAAVPVTGADAALPRVLAAADLAMAGLAFEQAEQQLRRALELLGSMPPRPSAPAVSSGCRCGSATCSASCSARAHRRRGPRSDAPASSPPRWPTTRPPCRRWPASIEA